MTTNLLLFFLAFGSLAGAQIAPTPPPAPGQMNHEGTLGMQHSMQGMDHNLMQHSGNQTQQAGSQTPVSDLLQDIGARHAMGLQEFQQFALAANPTIRQATAIVAQSAAQARQASLYPNPSIGYQGEQIRGGSYGGGEQGAFVQQTFILGGKLGLRRNIYEQQRRSDEISVSEQRLRVLGDIGQSFYSALAAQETVNLRKRLMALAMDAVTTAKQLANVGQADVPDVLQSEVEAEQAQVDYTTAQRTYIQSFHRLAALAGKPEIPVSLLQGDLENPPHLDEIEIVAQIVRESPSLKRAQQDVLRAQAELKSAKREVIPDLQVRAGVQQNFEPINEASGRKVGIQAFTTAAITLPIFNRNQGNVAAADASLQRAEAEVSRMQLSLQQNTQPLLQAYLSSQAQAERYRNEMIPRAARAYHLYLTKYQNMGAAYPQVLVSQRTLFQLQVGYISTLESLWKTAIGLQHFMLSSGLGGPAPSGSISPTLNLPTSIGGGAQ